MALSDCGGSARVGGAGKLPRQLPDFPSKNFIRHLFKSPRKYFRRT